MNPVVEEMPVSPRGRLKSRYWPLYLAFAATGLGCALPGVLLPAILANWKLDDRSGGMLFFLLSAGSSLGALVVREPLRLSIAGGCALVALAAAGLSCANRIYAFPLMLAYGLGLGVTMTGISLLSLRTRTLVGGVELVRLNLLWAAGASAAPAVMAHAVRVGDSRAPFLMTAASFGAFALCAWRLGAPKTLLPLRNIPTLRSWPLLLQIPVPLLLMTVLSTGIEASSGAWIATYAHREQHRFAFTMGGPTCLWAGLLASRLLGSLPRVESVVRSALVGFSFLVLLGSALLLTSQDGHGILLAAFLVGFGLGPLYPILLARVLQLHEVNLIFMLAGASSAFLPFLTGSLSRESGSLRTGLLVPATASLLLYSLAIKDQKK